jgi:hypothetical protein
MKWHTLWSGCALGALLFAGLTGSRGEDKKPETDKPDPMLEAYAKAGKPGPEHKRLEPLVGEWNYAGKFWMDPNKPPIEMKGTAKRKWILGDRFVQDEIEGPGFGEKFVGFGLLGYDNTQGKYTSFWIDSMTTAFSVGTGSLDASGKVLTYHREETDPLTKKKYKARDVIHMEDADKQVSQMYKEGPDGKEIKIGEIFFTRLKK